MTAQQIKANAARANLIKAAKMAYELNAITAEIDNTKNNIAGIFYQIGGETAKELAEEFEYLFRKTQLFVESELQKERGNLKQSSPALE